MGEHDGEAGGEIHQAEQINQRHAAYHFGRQGAEGARIEQDAGADNQKQRAEQPGEKDRCLHVTLPLALVRGSAGEGVLR